MASQAGDSATATLRAHGAMTLGIGSAVLLCSSLTGPPAIAASPDAYAHIRAEVDQSLKQDVLDRWYPAARNPRGGFLQDFREDWSPGANQEQGIVYQSRLTWVAAEASSRDPKRHAEYVEDARHGLSALETLMWDDRDGGLFWSVDNAGHPSSGNADKHAYGISFGIYAASAVYHRTHNPQALELARRGFHWLDGHAHDAGNGGYFEALSRSGTPIMTAPAGSPNDFIGTPYGHKSMNAHIHLLEAFTALYEVWPDPDLRSRLEELLTIVRDKVTTPDGYMNLIFQPDWTPAGNDDSYGHDIETAFLLVEACAALGKADDGATWAVSQRLVDHALRYGWDAEHGGFYDEGPSNGPAARKNKIWWVQAEGLNALLLMHERYGRRTPVYWNAFVKQWRFIADHQIDRRHHGWFPAVAADGTPKQGDIKSDGWTDPYHQGRALMNVSDRLRKLETHAERPSVVPQR